MLPSLSILRELTSAILACDHELNDSIVVVENELLLPPVFDPRKIFNVLLLPTQ